MQMDSDTMRQTLSGGLVVQGRPGLFTPADAYRLDVAYGSATSGGGDFDLSFTGDVEGALYTDASGTKIAALTIPDYDNLKLELENVKTTLSEVESAIERFESANADTEAVTGRLGDLESSLEQLRTATDTLRAELDNVSEDQRNYLRRVSESTVDGSLRFVDGYGIETYTLSGAQYETVTSQQQEPTNPDD